MRIGTVHEIESEAGVSFQLLLEEGGRHSATFCLPKEAGRLTALSRQLALIINSTAGSLLIVHETGVWRSSENMYLVQTFRQAHGEQRPIREAPVHMFASDDHNDCWTMTLLCFLNAWDFSLVSTLGDILIRGSHDECVDVCALKDPDVQRLRDLMRHFDIEEVQPNQGFHDRKIMEQLTSLDELRQLSDRNPADAAVRKRLARGLHEMSIDLQAVEDASYLEELRSLSGAHPQDSAVRESLAKSLYSALYYCFAERNLSQSDSLFEELRQLARNYPDDAAVRAVLAQSLVAGLHNARDTREGHKCHSFLEELQHLAQSHPEDSEVKQWLVSAGEI